MHLEAWSRGVKVLDKHRFTTLKGRATDLGIQDGIRNWETGMYLVELRQEVAKGKNEWYFKVALTCVVPGIEWRKCLFF